MTEKDIIENQKENSDTLFYVIQVGMFFHAYEGGAFALSRITGYQVRSVHRKTENIYICGFPVSRLDAVVAKMREYDITINYVGDNKKMFIFEGVDGSVDEGMVSEPLGGHSGKEKDIIDEIMAFNLATSTPIEAMMLINKLQMCYEKIR